MKNKLNVILVLILSIGLLACKKEATAISYPSDGNFGINILALPDSSILSPYQVYSFSADLEKDAELTVELVNLSDPNASILAIWSYDGQSQNGWLVNDYDFQYGTQVFKSQETGALDLGIDFSGSGSCAVNFYENGSTLNRTKYLFW